MKKIFTYLRRGLLLTLAVCLLLPGLLAVSADTVGQSVASSYYQIENGMVRGIAPGTTADRLTKVCTPGGLSLSGTTLATGMQLSGAGERLTVVVTGDLNGDGGCSITDMLLVKSHLLGQSLSQVASAAADVNYDTKVSITDFLQIKSVLLGMDTITAGWTRGAQPQLPLLLLTPGQSATWQTQGVRLAVEDEALATVSDDGTVTAGDKEGTTLVTALDEQGQVVERALVTVLQEKLTVTLSHTAYRLTTGKTVTFTPKLNHPVAVDINWSSSDTSVATVDTVGNVKALKPGTVTVTASVNNGSSAQVKLTVAPPITAVKTERTSYKIKPGVSKPIPLVLTPVGENEEFTWTSSNPAIATVSANGTVTGVKYGTVTITAKGKYSGLTASCKVKVCDVKQVAITFDDGPSNQTGKLLDYLEASDLRVTFFVVGNRMGSYSTNLKRAAAQGHEMGYHSYAHQQQTSLSSAQIRSDFDKANSQLKSMTGRSFTVWRTPGGGYNDRVLQAVPLPHILWSVDTQDWRSLNANSVYNSIMGAKDGSVILLHDLYGSSVDGAIRAMKAMEAGDYEFLTVTELLSRNGTPPKASTTYYRAP